MIVALFWLLLLAVWAIARRFGGWPEKSAATMYVVAAGASELLVRLQPLHHQRVDPGLFLIDAMLLTGLGLIALRTDLWWPLLSSALQLTTVLGHVAKALNSHVWGLAYAWMIQASAFPSLIVLAFAIYQRVRTRPNRSRR